MPPPARRAGSQKPPARLTVSTGLAKVGISYSSTNVSRGMYYARNPVPPGVEQEGSAGGIEVDDSTVGEGSDSDHGEEDDGSNTGE